MKILNRFGILWLLCVFLCSGCGKEAENQNMNVDNTESIQTGEPMTLMIYMVGSDLEAATAAASNDMKEMEASGVNLEQTNILVYTGGSPKWHHDSVEVPSDKHTILELTENGFSKVTEFENQSMGESDTLTRFLQYGYENYPSESYGLILWDHGNGPVMGYGSDLQYGKDAMTLPEIETALQKAPFQGENKFSFIGFDACLMASVELACMVDDYADYLIASQEVEPGFGWNYAFLSQCGKVDTKTLANSVVEYYMAYCEDYFAQNEFFKSDITLSVVDLSYAKQLEESVDQLFKCATNEITDYFSQRALERVETRAFGRATTGSEYDLVDVQALMDSMKNSYKKETIAVSELLEQMIVHSASNTADSCGLSLYYPYYNKEFYESSWKESYQKMNLLPNYMDYLDEYGQIWLGTDMKEIFTGKLIAQETETGIYTLQLSQEQAAHYADSSFYILRKMGDDLYSIVYSSPNVTNEDGLLTADFDGWILYYGDDLGFKGIPVTKALDEVDGETRYAIFPFLNDSADFLESKRQMARIVLSVDEESEEVSVLDFSEYSEEAIQTGKKPQINLEDWISIDFYEVKSRYLTRDEDQRILNYWQWPEGEWIIANTLSIADGLNFTYEPLYDDGEEYYLMFDIMDSQGSQYSSELYPITLEKAPEAEKTQVTMEIDVKNNRTLIFEQDGVKLWFNLVKDHENGMNGYCFEAENNNDFPVILTLDNILVNDRFSCTDSKIFMSVDAKETSYKFADEVSLVCMHENKKLAEKLSFTANMSNAENEKTLIHQEVFLLSVLDSAKSEITFVPFYGVTALEQVIIEETNQIKVTLLGAGYQLTHSSYVPNQEFANLSGYLKIENISNQEQPVRIEQLKINGKPFDMQSEVLLNSGQVYYYPWDLFASDLTEQNISSLSTLEFVINGKTANVQLESQ